MHVYIYYKVSDIPSCICTLDVPGVPLGNLMQWMPSLEGFRNTRPHKHGCAKRWKIIKHKMQITMKKKKKTGRISIFILTANRIFPTAPIESVISRNVCSSFISQTKVGGKKETEDKDLLYKERVWGGKFLKGSKCPLDQAAYSCSFY